MASIMHTNFLEISQTSKLASLGNTDLTPNRNFLKSSFISKASVSSNQTGEFKLSLTSKCSKKQDRFSNFVTSCVATSLDTNVSSDTPESPGIGFDQRRKAADDYSAAKPYRLQEVETVGQQEYNATTVSSVSQIAPNARCITVDAEISRELVSLDNAYTKPGQTVKVKLSNGDVVQTIPSSAPFPSEFNSKVLLKMRGDIPAGTTKLPQVSLSVRTPLDLHVTESSPLYNLQSGDELSLGPFEGGLDLRPILFLSRYPTVLIFAEGEGIAIARAILEAKDVGSLYLNMRKDVRLYYSADTPADMAYMHLHEDWSKKVNFRPAVNSVGENAEFSGFVGSFAALFDDDDLEYDPETTVSVVCVRAAQKDKIVDLLNEAGIDMKQVIFADV